MNCVYNISIFHCVQSHALLNIVELISVWKWKRNWRNESCTKRILLFSLVVFHWDGWKEPDLYYLLLIYFKIDIERRHDEEHWRREWQRRGGGERVEVRRKRGTEREAKKKRNRKRGKKERQKKEKKN